MLLAGTGAIETGENSTYRDEREKVNSFITGRPSQKVKVTARENKGDGENKVPSRNPAHRADRHKRDDKVRREAERADRRSSAAWRSAQELGVRYPESKCGESAHHYIRLSDLSGGTIYICKKCMQPLWLPSYYFDAVAFGVSCNSDGKDVTYCKYISRRPQLLTVMVDLIAISKLELSANTKMFLFRQAIVNYPDIDTLMSYAEGQFQTIDGVQYVTPAKPKFDPFTKSIYFPQKGDANYVGKP